MYFEKFWKNYPYSLRFNRLYFCNQDMCIKNWTLNYKFPVKNGIKQGGVLYPILLAVYICELLLTLKSQEEEI